MSTDMKSWSIEALAKHAETVGWPDIIYGQVEPDVIDPDSDDEADDCSNAASDAYDANRLALQRAHAAFYAWTGAEALFERGSDVDELYTTIFRVAYESGWKAGRGYKQGPAE